MGASPQFEVVDPQFEIVDPPPLRPEVKNAIASVPRPSVQHMELPKTLARLDREYGDRLAITAVDNSKSPAQAIPVEKLDSMAYAKSKDELISDQQAELDKLHASGAIDKDLHAQLSTKGSAGGAATGGIGSPEPGRGTGEGEVAPGKVGEMKVSDLKLTSPPADIGIHQYIDTLPKHHQAYARAFYDALTAKGADAAREVEPRDFGIPEHEMDGIEKLDGELERLAKGPEPVGQPAPKEPTAKERDWGRAEAYKPPEGGAFSVKPVPSSFWKEANTGAVLAENSPLDNGTGLASFNGNSHIWRWPWGSTFQFAYCASDNDVYAHQTQSYTCILWDESTRTASEFMVRYLLTRLRSTDSSLFLRCRLGTNPGGPFADWQMKMFLGGVCPHCEPIVRKPGAIYDDSKWPSDTRLRVCNFDGRTPDSPELRMC